MPLPDRRDAMSGEDDAAEDTKRSRPSTEGSYGIPQHSDGMLTWDFVERRLTDEHAYWVTTLRPDGNPHVRPTWGVWVEGTFYCGGGERTRWVRNLSTNADIVVHPRDAEEVVIIEGTAERIDDDTANRSLLELVDRAYESKYGIEHGAPFFAVRPATVFAWSEYPADATRWQFADE
jgi:nitroimidazol reductase NimA-like FMN-containing flavoprotein (pyridoxamine 5'-phosphate oxidase superfamily)